MERTNKKQTTKFYDDQTVNGWALNYEYESTNGGKPTEIRVTGTKDTGSFFANKNNGNISVSFGGNSQMDAEVITAVQSEFVAIEATFEVEQ
ncbi:hypothetical protein [Pedobacter sp. KBW01]|uniref:hypothetical protein n=1 Tax=Pedobacter sp. KBW01 TaxID=2153364 RepID=UPI000F5B3428|nr:hypothetical protein [Pedobacter sp. KBW01]